MKHGELTRDDLAELSALAETNAAVGKSFIMRFHWWLSGYQRLVRRGLVEWSDPPEGFDKRKFAGTLITPAGLALLKSLERPDA